MASLTGREIEDCTPLSKSPYPLIVAFGDSITERGSNIFAADHPDGRGTGWTALLQSKLSAIADVVTRGFSGFNTASALKALPYVFPGLSKNARVVLVWFGANDAVVQGRGSQFIDVQVYGGNLKTICEAVRRMNVTPVLITPPPLQQEDADADSHGLRVNENTAKYAEKCLAVAKEVCRHEAMLRCSRGFDVIVADKFYFLPYFCPYTMGIARRPLYRHVHRYVESW